MKLIMLVTISPECAGSEIVLHQRHDRHFDAVHAGGDFLRGADRPGRTETREPSHRILLPTQEGQLETFCLVPEGAAQNLLRTLLRTVPAQNTRKSMYPSNSFDVCFFFFFQLLIVGNDAIPSGSCAVDNCHHGGHQHSGHLAAGAELRPQLVPQGELVRFRVFQRHETIFPLSWRAGFHLHRWTPKPSQRQYHYRIDRFSLELLLLVPL